MCVCVYVDMYRVGHGGAVLALVLEGDVAELQDRRDAVEDVRLACTAPHRTARGVYMSIHTHTHTQPETGKTHTHTYNQKPVKPITRSGGFGTHRGI